MKYSLYIKSNIQNSEFQRKCPYPILTKTFPICRFWECFCGYRERAEEFAR